MLSKSSARWFFIIGTSLFSLIFLGLTVDTMRQAPARTNEQNLTAEVKRGKEIWDSNNCMGCHTLMGEGAYYAPELTKAYERRGPAWLKLFLKDPQAMYPNQRKMVQYNFNDEEIEEVIQFLKWIGEMDLNGFPKKPYLAAKTAEAAISSSGVPENHSGEAVVDPRPEVFKTLCVACHSYGGTGGNLGPALDSISAKMNPEQLRVWLKDPKSVKADTTMPNLNLSTTQVTQLVQFLSQPK